MPRISAALRRLPLVSRSAASIVARSTSAIVIPGRYNTSAAAAGSASTGPSGGAPWPTSMTSTRWGRSSMRRRSSDLELQVHEAVEDELELLAGYVTARGRDPDR